MKDAEEFKLEETKQNIKDHILEQKRDDRLRKREARRYRDMVEAHDEEDETLFIERMDPDLFDFLGEPWEYTIRGYSNRFLFLRDKLLPFFKGILKKELEGET